MHLARAWALNDILLAQDDSSTIANVSKTTAAQSSKSLEDVKEISKKFNTLVDLISSSHEEMVSLQDSSVFNNLQFIKNESTFKSENVQTIVDNFKNMEDASGELFNQLDIMIKEA